MKSIVKTVLTVSALLPLAGCLDFGWSKKENQQQEQGQAPMHAQEAEKKAGQCSHKGCTHDHSKDGEKKHHDEVKVQDEDDMNMDEDAMEEDADVETQGMDDEEEDDMDDNQ